MNIRQTFIGTALTVSSVLLSLGAATVRAQNARQETDPNAKAVVAASTKPDWEPKAIDIIKASCARLAAAHSMSFTAEVTYESPSRKGFPLAYTTKSEVLLQRPDKLRLTLGGGPASEFYSSAGG